MRTGKLAVRDPATVRPPEQDLRLGRLHAMHRILVRDGPAGFYLCRSGPYGQSEAVALGLAETGVVVTS